jgi:hypothetical protein
MPSSFMELVAAVSLATVPHVLDQHLTLIVVDGHHRRGGPAQRAAGVRTACWSVPCPERRGAARCASEVAGPRRTFAAFLRDPRVLQSSK